MTGKFKQQQKCKFSLPVKFATNLKYWDRNALTDCVDEDQRLHKVPVDHNTHKLN